MHWAIYIFGSGLAFFLGVTCLLLAIGVTLKPLRRAARTSTIFAAVGLILVVVSAAPLPIWEYVVLVGIVAVWSGARRLQRTKAQAAVPWLAALTAIALIGPAIVELRYQFPARLPSGNARDLYLFGDSLSAGVDDHATNNWPQLLAQSHHIELTNLAVPGAKITTAARKARQVNIDGGVVLLEIGGNDLLDSLASAEFERQLNDLLRIVCGQGRTVVMFELPLPPFHDTYGLAQRRLAAKFDVHLIPKRILMDVLATDGNTLDSIHLTPAGHRRMAERVWKVLEPAFESRVQTSR